VAASGLTDPQRERTFFYSMTSRPGGETFAACEVAILNAGAAEVTCLAFGATQN
jgi:hypothetical protein